MKQIYQKPFLDYQTQIKLLKQRNLTFKDENFALKKLSQIGYYRLSGYFSPFQTEPDKFENATFEEVVELYEFDKRLREILFSSIAEFEVFIRAKITYTYTQKYGAFGYLDASNLQKDKKSRANFLKKYATEFKNSNAEFVKHFKDNYENEHLPLWMLTEILPFGNVAKFYELMHKNDRQKISSIFDIGDDFMRNWLHALSVVRNMVAHHSRLWNATLSIGFKIPRKNGHFNGISNGKNLFCIYTVLCYLLKKANLKNTLKSEFSKLLDDFSLYNKFKTKFEGVMT